MTDVGTTPTGTTETNVHEPHSEQSDTEASPALALALTEPLQSVNSATPDRSTMTSTAAVTATSANTDSIESTANAASLPRASPWNTWALSPNDLAAGVAAQTTTNTTSLTSIMAEQQADQNQRQIRMAQQAQEDELLRQALEQSRITAQQEAQERGQRQKMHSTNTTITSSVPVPAASSNPSATGEQPFTELEIAQIRQALEESESRSKDVPQAFLPGISTGRKDDTEATTSSTTATTNQDSSNNVNWQAAAEFLSPEELQQIQQALADSTEPVASDGLPSRHVQDEEMERSEQASYQLALELARQEFAPEAMVVRAHRQPEGHVRVVPRAQILQQRAGAFHATGPVNFVHPADLAVSSSRNQAATAASNGANADDEDDTVVHGTAAGFRMNAATPQDWNRRARDGHTVVGPDAQVRTKHDASLDAQANAHRLALDVDTAVVGNKAFNAFHQSMKRSKVKGVAASGTGRAGSDADGVKGGAMDGRVREQLSKIVNQGWISKLNGAVKEGKEALVYHGEQGEGSGGFDVAVKVFKRIQEFRGRGNYVDGDLRYAKTPFGKIGQREQLEMWTEKEFRNLVRANRSGVPVATPLYYKDNILLMRFLGEDGWPCPQLRELDLRKGSSRWTTLYTHVMQSIKLLYQQAHLVHGDLSEYNILAVPAWLVENKLVVDVKELQAVLIDFGQAVEFRHPDAEALLRRDLDRVNAFFVRQGVVSVMPAEEAYLFCTMDPQAMAE